MVTRVGSHVTSQVGLRLTPFDVQVNNDAILAAFPNSEMVTSATAEVATIHVAFFQEKAMHKKKKISATQPSPGSTSSQAHKEPHKAPDVDMDTTSACFDRLAPRCCSAPHIIHDCNLVSVNILLSIICYAPLTVQQHNNNTSACQNIITSSFVNK